MKIAVKNSDGMQLDISGKLRYYYEVNDDYNFESNDATDVTDLSSLGIFKNSLRIDHIKFRDGCRASILPSWSSLTVSEQKELVSHFIYPVDFIQSDIDAIFTMEEQVENWKRLAEFTKIARYNRWEAARKRVSFDLTTLESLLFYQDTKPFKDDYIDANLPYLTLWISNGSYAPLEIDFTTTGFSGKSYYTETRKNICLDILVNGNYQ
jgi:hypothetical protein